MADPYDGYDPNQPPSTQPVPFPTNSNEFTDVGVSTLITQTNERWRPSVEAGAEAWDFVETSDEYYEAIDEIRQAHANQGGDLPNTVMNNFATFFDILDLGSGAMNTLGWNGFDATIGRLSEGMTKMLRDAQDAWNNGGTGSGSDDSGGSNGEGDDRGGYPRKNINPPKDPLLIDLDGDGLELLAPEVGVYFNMDADAFAEKVSWVAPDDGIIVRDINSNGLVDDSGEMFGTDSLTGHQHLAQFDGNADGKIDASDAIYQELRVWQDANSDGVTQASELSSLADLGIAEISLAAVAMNSVESGGRFLASGSSTLVSGEQRSVYSVAFFVDQTDTTEQLPEEWVLNQEVRLLPKIAGLGTISDLSIAMTLNPDLLAEVRSFCLNLQTMSAAEAVDAAKSILFTWAGVDNVDPASRGAIDAQALAVIEKITGISQPAVIQDGWLQDNLNSYFEALLNGFTTRLAVQAWGTHALYAVAEDPFALITVGVFYNPTRLLTAGNLEDGQHLQQDLTINIAALGAELSAAGTNFDEDALTNLIVPMLRLMAVDRYGSVAAADAALLASLGDVAVLNPLAAGRGFAAIFGNGGIEGTASSETVQMNPEDRFAAGLDGDDTIIGTSSGEIIEGGAGNDLLQAGLGVDLLIGGLGNDRLEGGKGADTYIYNPGDGDDVIFDYQESDGVIDQLAFGAGINPADIIFSRVTSDSNDIRISFAGQSGSIIFDGQWWNDAGVEKIVFADGTVWTEAEIASRYVAVQTTSANDTIWGSRYADNVIGDAGDDTLLGYDGTDALNGGLGNDRLEGGKGADTYIYNPGDGDDVIFDYQESDGVIDTLAFGAGINPADIIFSRVTSDSNDIRISFAGQSGSIIFDGQWWNDAGVERVTFTDGTVWNHADILARYVAAQSTAGNDTIWGSPFAEILSGGQGNDRLEGGKGTDTYIYNPGDGDDVIFDYQESDGTIDTLSFGADINPADIIFSRVTSDSNDIRISFAGQAGSIIFDGQWWNDAGIEKIQFADGTTWSLSDIAAHYIADQQTADNDTIWGTPYNDTVIAGDGNDTMKMGAGNDVLEGGAGNDTLLGEAGIDAAVYAGAASGVSVNLAVTTAQDTVGAGIDTLSGIENLKGSAFNDVLAGNSSANTIEGGAGSDVLNGGAGNDILIGGADEDSFLFSTALSGTGNVDQIIDFMPGNDRIDLSQLIFSALGPSGTLDASAFQAGTAANDAQDRIIYDPSSGKLYYDADGNGAGAEVLFAQVTAGLPLVHSDFVVI